MIDGYIGREAIVVHYSMKEYLKYKDDLSKMLDYFYHEWEDTKFGVSDRFLFTLDFISNREVHKEIVMPELVEVYPSIVDEWQKNYKIEDLKTLLKHELIDEIKEFERQFIAVYQGAVGKRYPKIPKLYSHGDFIELMGSSKSLLKKIIEHR